MKILSSFFLIFFFSCKTEFVKQPICGNSVNEFLENKKHDPSFKEKEKIALAIKAVFQDPNNGDIDANLVRDLNMNNITIRGDDDSKIKKVKLEDQTTLKIHLQKYFDEVFIPEIFNSTILKKFNIKDIESELSDENKKKFIIDYNKNLEIFLLQTDNVSQSKDYKSYYLVYMDGDKGLGFLKFDYSTYHNYNSSEYKKAESSKNYNIASGNFAYMDLFATSKKARGQGVGFFLNMFFEKCVREKIGENNSNKVDYIHLYTFNREEEFKKNRKKPAAYSFYRKNGYENAYHHVENSGIDKKTVYMIKELK